VTSSEQPGTAPGTSGAPGSSSLDPQDPLSTTPRTPAPSTGGAIGTAPPPSSTARRRARATGRGLFLALLIFVTVVLVLFVVFNTQTVQISLVFGDVRAPLVLALVIAAALGGLVIGLLALLRGAARRRNSS
jgi:uncharacterized integral membrane protein